MEATPTNPTELDLQTTLPAIQFDYAGLKAWAQGIAEKYAGVVVTEDQIIGTKAEMAELNRIKKQLDAARIAAVKKVSEPIRDFEAQVKEVCGIFQETYDFLGGQVKNYEERAREEKRQQVQFMIEAVTAEQGYPGLAIPIQDSWLAKSKPMKTVKAEVEAIILAHIKAERDKAALEQAKQDRAALIEKCCEVESSRFGVRIVPSEFLALNNLELPMAEVEARIARAFDLKAQAVREQAMAPAPQPATAPAGHMMTMQEGATAPGPVRKTMHLVLEYDSAREGDVLQAVRHLEGLCLRLTRGAGTSTSSFVPSSQQQPPARPVRRY